MSPVISPVEATVASRIPLVPRHIGVPVHPAAASKTGAKGIVGKAAAEANELQQPQLTSEQQTAGKLQGVKTFFMIPAQLDFGGMIVGGGLGWVAKKLGWQRAQGGIAIAAHAPVQALRTTTLGEILRLPAKFFAAASDETKKVGGRAEQDWKAGLDKRSSKWMERATGMTTAQIEEAQRVHAEQKLKGAAVTYTEGSLEGRIATKMQRHFNRVGGWLESFQNTQFGTAVQKKLHGFMQGRHTTALEKHNAAILKAEEAVTTESFGFFKSKINWFRGIKPGKPGAGELSAIAEELHASKGLKGSDLTTHLTGVKDTLETLLRGPNLEAGVKARAGAVMTHLQKALGKAQTLETFGHAAEDASKVASLRTMAGAMAKVVGRVPVFTALLAVGATAGIGAVLVTAHGESKEAKEAFKKLNTELADQPNSSFMKSIKAAQKNSAKWSAVKTGMRMSSEVAESAMWTMHNGGGAGMMGAMMLPQLCEMMVPGNAMLGALEALDKSGQGKLQLKPADRMELLTHVIGGIKSAEGQPIRYTVVKAMAAEMQERGFNYSDIVNTLGRDAKFHQFVAEVSAKQQAEAAQKATELKAADAIVEKAPVAAAMAAPTIAAGPTTHIRVGATEAQHKGMVAGNHQLAMG